MHLLAHLLILSHLFTLLTCRSDRATVTYVTALYDIGRGQLKGYSRPHEYYLTYFAELLQTTANIVIFGQPSLKPFVLQHRKDRLDRTFFVEYPFENVSEHWESKMALKIVDQRTKESHTSRKRLQFYLLLPNYIPLVLSKRRWLQQAASIDPFDSQHFYWVDAGYAHYDDTKSFIETNLYEPFELWLQNWWCYRSVGWVDGNFKTDMSLKYLGHFVNNNYRTRAGFYGGKKDYVRMIGHLTEPLLQLMLDDGYLLTEESVTSAAIYRYPLAFHTGFVLDRDFTTFIVLNRGAKRQVALTWQIERQKRMRMRSKYSILSLSDRMTLQADLCKKSLLLRCIVATVMYILYARFKGLDVWPESQKEGIKSADEDDWMRIITDD